MTHTKHKDAPRQFSRAYTVGLAKIRQKGEGFEGKPHPTIERPLRKMEQDVTVEGVLEVDWEALFRFMAARAFRSKSGKTNFQGGMMRYKITSRRDEGKPRIANDDLLRYWSPDKYEIEIVEPLPAEGAP